MDAVKIYLSKYVLPQNEYNKTDENILREIIFRLLPDEKWPEVEKIILRNRPNLREIPDRILH